MKRLDRTRAALLGRVLMLGVFLYCPESLWSGTRAETQVPDGCFLPFVSDPALLFNTVPAVLGRTGLNSETSFNFDTDPDSASASRQVLESLSDGYYLYVIVQKDLHSTPLIGVSTLVPKSVLERSRSGESILKYLVRHEILLTQLAKEHNFRLEEAESMLRAAGTFTVLGKRVFQLTNRAGTYKGNETHLNYAVKVLEAAGLPIEQKTALVEYSSLASDPYHAKEHKIGRMMLRVYGNSESLDFKQKFINAYLRLSHVFPKKNSFGLDLNEFMNFLERNSSFLRSMLDSQGEYFKDDRSVYFRLLQFGGMLHSVEVEGTDFAVGARIFDFGEDEPKIEKMELNVLLMNRIADLFSQAGLE